MILVGALLAALAAASFLAAVAPRPSRLRAARGGIAFIRESTIDRGPANRARRSQPLTWLTAITARLGVGARWISRQDLVEAGIDPDVITPAEVMTLKLLAASAAGFCAAVLSAVTPGLLLLTPAAAWAGFIAPSIYLSRRRGRRRAQIQAELPDLVGLLRAFVNAQVPLEQALNLISLQLSRSDPGNVLAAELRVALGDYGLGQTIEESLARMADRLGVDEVKTLVAAIAQGKRLGAGIALILRDQELLVRMGQRNRATAAASQVSTRLMGVLVGVYLPEFIILIMVPLFWGIMLRAFG